MYTILSGKEPAAEIFENATRTIIGMKKKPHLAIILVGNDPASEVYVRKKIEKAAEIGLRTTLKRLPEHATEEQLLKAVHQLNKDKNVDGFLVQWPIPKHIDYARIVEAIDPRKDVDGWTSTNIGKMFLGVPETFLPATPSGVIRMLDYYKAVIAGKHAVVIGRGNVVGKPLAFMLLARDATVTICHSKTENLAAHTRKADILVAAAGSPFLVKASMVKKGAYVIDVGTTRLEGRIVGDVEFAKVIRKAHCSPVPGGVGPMTIAMLINNVIEAALRNESLGAAS